MDAKLRSAVEKIHQDRDKGNHQRALKRVADAVKRYPDSSELYREAVDACIEAGESLQALDYLKRAFTRFHAERDDLHTLARDRAADLNDAVVGKFLVEQAIKRRELHVALSTLEPFQDRAVRDLLQRTRMKRTSLTSAARGGHAVSGEMTTNLLCDAILDLRLGRIDDAVKTLREFLDRQPEQFESITTLLERIVESHAGSADALYALARCRMMDARHKDAAETLVQAVRVDGLLAEPALALLRDAAKSFDETPEPLENALVEILLVAEKHERAAELLRARLEREPARARWMLELVRPYVAGDGGMTPLRSLFLDAAVEADATAEVAETLRSLADGDENRAAVLEWLDARSKDHFLSPDAMVLHAELAIEAGRYADAAELLRAVSTNSPDERSRISAIVDRHRAADPALESLYEELTRGQAQVEEPNDALALDPIAPEASVESDPRDFEHFESSGFQFSHREDAGESAVAIDAGEPAPPAVAPGGAADDDLDPDFNIYDGSSILGSHTESGAPRPIASTTPGARRPLDHERAGIVWDEEDGDGAVDDGPREPAAVPSDPAVNEDYVQNLAGALYQSGASTFFHIGEGDDQPDTQETAEQELVVEEAVAEEEPVVEEPVVEEAVAEEEPAEQEPVVEEPVAGEEPAEQEPVVEEPVAEEEPAEQEPVVEEPVAQEEPIEQEPPAVEAELSFEERFARFQDGKLSAEETLELMEEAAAQHLVEELGQVLRLSPDGDGGGVRRELCQVEYHLMNAEPAAALDSLERLRDADLTEEQRKEVWLQTVAGQRMMRDYDSAHRTLVRLVDLYPDCEQVARLAKVNYREYLQNQCTEAPVLEKVTSLDGDF